MNDKKALTNDTRINRIHKTNIILTWIISTILFGITFKNHGLSRVFFLTIACMYGGALLLTILYFIKFNQVAKGIVIVCTISTAGILCSIFQGGSFRAYMVTYIVIGLSSLYFNAKIQVIHGSYYFILCVILSIINPAYIDGPNPDMSNVIILLATYASLNLIIFIGSKSAQDIVNKSIEAAQAIEETAAKNKELSINLYESITESNNDVQMLSENINSISKGALNMQQNMLDSLSRTNSLRDVVAISDQRVQENYDCTKELKMSFDEVVDGVNTGIQTVTEVKDDMNVISNAITSAREATDQMLGQMNKITTILNDIDSISLQTNILSLNASVEAARSGEHGKGFSVVAGEIRELAAKSAESAKNIAEIVSELISITKIVSERVINGDETVKEGSRKIQLMVDCFNSLNTVASNVGTIVERENNIIEEFKNDYSAMSSEIYQVTEATQENVDMVEEIVTSIEEQNSSVLNISSQLKQLTKVSKSLNVNADN